MAIPPATPASIVVVDGDIPINATVYNGTGPALVLIHGISSAGETWWPVIDALAEHFTIVAIDQRGHGASGKPATGYLYDDYIDDLERVLAHFALEHPLILGHSLGGIVTLWWAARHPDQAAALVIEDSPLRSGEEFRPAFDNWLELNALPVDEVNDRYAEEHPAWKPEIVRRRAELMTSTARNVFAELKADSMAHHGVDRIREIEHIRSPVLLIHGDLDANGMVHQSDADAFASRLAHATAYRIPGGNHGLHTDHHRAFLAAALPFLEDHAANASFLRLHQHGGT